MMKRAGRLRKCRVALDSIAVRYFPAMDPQQLAPGTDASGASAAGEAIYFDFTLDVMDATTIDAILN
jgi:hypothetical protein